MPATILILEGPNTMSNHHLTLPTSTIPFEFSSQKLRQRRSTCKHFLRHKLSTWWVQRLPLTSNTCVSTVTTCVFRANTGCTLHATQQQGTRLSPTYHTVWCATRTEPLLLCWRVWTCPQTQQKQKGYFNSGRVISVATYLTHHKRSHWIIA